MSGLYRMVCTYTDEIEADLQRYFTTDLHNLFRGGLSLRRVGVLVRSLPAESLTMSALAADTDPTRIADPRYPRRFSVDQHLAATVVDAVNALHHTYQSAHSKTRPPSPARVPRPGHTSIRRRLTTTERELIRARNRGTTHGI